MRANGIGFEWVEHEKGASIDGYSFISNGSPYIVVTLRYNRIDNFAFTIMHEIGHIDMGHKHGSQLAEVIANHYAGYALAPSPLIQK